MTFISKVPPYVIGLVLLAPVWALQHMGYRVSYRPESVATNWLAPLMFFFVLFIPGSILRRSWRQVLLMMGIAAGLYAADAAFASWSPLPFPYWWVPLVGLPVVAVGVAEWWLTRPRSAASFVVVLALCLAIAFVVPVIIQMLDLAPRAVFSMGESRRETSWGELVRWPLYVVLTWIAVPVTFGIARHYVRRSRVIAAGVIAGSAALFLLYFHVLMYALARQSLDGGGPFRRDAAVAVLELRANRGDVEALWRTAEAAHWTASEDHYTDYRRSLIDALIRIDREAAAPRLSRMIRETPSPLLAELSAELLAAERQYEALPVLTRYALLNGGSCTTALEMLKVPHVALRLMAEASAYDRPVRGAQDFPVQTERRQRLIRLLGHDAGAKLSDWINFYDSRAHELPAAFSSEVNAETVRVVEAMLTYWEALNRLRDARGQVIARRLHADGDGELVEKLRGLHTTMSTRDPTDGEIISALSPAGLSRIEKQHSGAALDMKVSPPDWNVRGTDALENEVGAYVKRVNATIEKHLPPETRPSTAPASSGD